jgi:hypothetical protein
LHDELFNRIFQARGQVLGRARTPLEKPACDAQLLAKADMRMKENLV